MKKILFISVIVISCTLNLFSQVEDETSKKILKDSNDKLMSYIDIKADFTYKMENKTEKINESKTGSLFLKKDKYRVEIAGQVIICDGKTVWTYLKESNEVQINNMRTDDDALNPATILTNFDKNFRSKYIKDATENKKDMYVIDLVPKKTKQYFKVRINVEKSTKHIVSIIAFDKNGGSYSYLINKFQSNNKIDDSVFAFQKADYPGVEIIDMREK